MSVSLILLEIVNADAKGDVTVTGAADQIAVESFSWGVGAEVTDKTGSDPKPNIKPQNLQLKKQFDGATTSLSTLMQKDDSFDAVLRFIDPSSQASGNPPKYESVLEIELKQCHIESITLGASETGKSINLSESIVISFEQSITFSYRTYSPITRRRAAAKPETIFPSGGTGSA